MLYHQLLGRRDWVLIPNQSLDHSTDQVSTWFTLAGVSRFRAVIKVTVAGTGNLAVNLRAAAPTSPPTALTGTSAPALEIMVSPVGATGYFVGDSLALSSPICGTYRLEVDHSAAIGNWQYEVSLSVE